MKKFTILFILFTVFFTVTSVIGADITSFSTGGNWSASAWPVTVRTGTISASPKSTTVTGNGTSFLTEISIGNIIMTLDGTIIGVVASRKDGNTLDLVNKPSSTYTNIPYKVQGVGAGDNVTIDGPVIVDSVAGLSVGYSCNNLIINSSKVFTIQDRAIVPFLTVNGDFKVGNNAIVYIGGTRGGRLLLDGGGHTHDIYGTIYINWSVQFNNLTNNSPLSTMNIGKADGLISGKIILVEPPNNGVLMCYGSVKVIVHKNSSIENYCQVTTTGYQGIYLTKQGNSGVPSLQIDGTLTNGSSTDPTLGTIYIVSPSTLIINGTLNFVSGTGVWTTNNANGAVYGPNGLLVYSGPALTPSLFEWPATNSPPNVTINSTGNITMGAARTITGILYLQKNQLVNGSNLTMGTNATIKRSDGSISATPAGTSYNIIYSGINPILTGPEIPDATTVLNNLNDSNTNTVSLNKITTVNGTFLLAAGSTFDISANNYALNVKKDFVNNGTFIPRNGTVTLNGTTLQNIGGNNSTTFYNLTLNNTGGISLGRNETVSNTFTMSSGSISTNANILELGTSTSNLGTLTYTSGNIITGSTGGFKRWFNDKPVSFVRFPVGTANYTNMITLNDIIPTSAGSLTARFIQGSPGGSAVTQLDDEGYPYSINALSLKGYWQIDVGDNLNVETYSVSLRAQGFYPSMGAEVTNYEQLRILKRHSSGGDWILDGIHANATGSNTDPTMQRVGLSGFSQFAMGGSSDDGNPLDGPLPVKLTSFSSVLNGRGVKLNWVTEMEENNSGFEVQKSEYRIQESEVWNKIGFVKGNGTKNSSTNYSFEDRNLQTGKYKYRLKQIDYNGNYEYFELTGFVEVGVPAKYDLSQNYPNPFNPVTKINFDILVNGLVTLKVYDILGKEVASLVNETREAGYYTVSFNASSLSSGVYFYRLNANGFSSVKKFVVMK